jgi:hypothetical protein
MDRGAVGPKFGDTADALNRLYGAKFPKVLAGPVDA